MDLYRSILGMNSVFRICRYVLREYDLELLFSLLE
jgi:hypothetical protein